MKIKLALLLSLLLVGCSEEAMNNIETDEFIKEVEASENVEVAKIDEVAEEDVTIEANPLTDIEHEYLDVVSESLGVFTEKSENLSVLISEYESNPLVVNDVEWVNKIRGEFFIITMFSNLLADMNNTESVPKRFEELHHYVYECFDLMSIAGDKMIESIENGLDEELMYGANSYISASDTMFEQVEKEIDKIELEISGG